MNLGDAMELALLGQIANMTDPKTLITEGHCYVCYGASTAQVLKLALLARISKNHNSANKTDPDSLIAQGQCLECFGMVSIPKLMELVLFSQIAS